MEPIHIVTEKSNIAPLVLLPGDPLRAKYIAENFLENYELVNEIRGMLYYTGYYKGKRITVGGSGMGCPSMGVYAYELYHFYNVEKIIRIGSSGSLRKDIKILDVVLSIGSYSESAFAYHWSKSRDRYIPSSMELNTIIADTADRKNMDVKIAPTITSDTFDVWNNIDHITDKCPIKDKLGCCEMEGFALFHVAKTEGKQAAMLATVVDSKFEPDDTVPPAARQTALNDMIELTLDSIIKE
jgi:purine-nucleoside phosphorylase